MHTGGSILQKHIYARSSMHCTIAPCSRVYIYTGKKEKSSMSQASYSENEGERSNIHIRIVVHVVDAAQRNHEVRNEKTCSYTLGLASMFSPPPTLSPSSSSHCQPVKEWLPCTFTCTRSARKGNNDDDVEQVAKIIAIGLTGLVVMMMVLVVVVVLFKVIPPPLKSTSHSFHPYITSIHPSTARNTTWTTANDH